MRPGRRLAVALGASVGLAAAAVVVAFAAGLRLDLSRWRGTVAQQASDALGRPVALEGALQLSLGRTLQLRTGGLRIGNPAGFGTASFVAVGSATLRADLFDVLRGRLRLRGIEASDVELHFERAQDGRANWHFPPAEAAALARPMIDLGPIKLQRLLLDYRDLRTATHHGLALDELTAVAGPHDALRLTLKGVDEERQAYRLRLEGGSLQAWQQAAEPWPLRGEFKSGNAWLQLQGAVDAPRGQARLQFGAGADDIARIARRLGAQVPEAGGAVYLSGSVEARAGALGFTDLQGRWGDATLSGALRWQSGADRQRLSGALQVSQLDLRPWLQAAAPASAGLPQDEPAWLRTPLRTLLPWDLALELSLGRAIGLPVALTDARLTLQADRAGLRAPLRATVAGAALSGQVDLDLSAAVPALALRLDSRDLVLQTLVQAWPALQGLQGQVGQARLRLGGQGDTLAAVLDRIEGSFDMAAVHGRFHPRDAARPFDFALDTLRLEAGPGAPLQGRAQGVLLGQPTRLSMRSGPWPALPQARSLPLALSLEQDRATLQVQGKWPLPSPQGAAVDSTWGFALQARRSGDLAPWLPVAASSALPVALQGQLRRSPQAWSLERTVLQLGGSQFQLDARHAHGGDRPLITARLRGTRLDVPELSTLVVARAPAETGARLDAPLRADGFDLADVDLDVALQQVWLGRVALSDVVGLARTRQGRLLPSSITGRVADAAFTAQLAIDPLGAVPAATLDLATRDIDVGALLRALGVAEDIDARADSLHLALQARGHSLRELAAGTSLQARWLGGRVMVQGPASRPAVEFTLHEADVDAPAGQPITLALKGEIEQTPLRLGLRTGTFADLAGDATRVPFAMAAHAAGTRLSLDGEVSLPLGRAGQLVFEMSGQRLDALSGLARVELPAWGPWSIRGPIRMTPTGYELQDLALAVGQSRLAGSGRLDVAGARPRAELQVQASRIQLDDFPMPARLTDDPPAQPETRRGTATRTAGQIDRLLSARFLRRFDARLQVQAGEVLSGADRLADGAFQLTLQEGRLDLDPAVLNLPGGGMRLSMSYDLKQSEVDFHVAAQVERFDYGIIARRLNRANDLRGLFSMNLYLAGRAPSLESTLLHAQGQLDVAVWPTELRSGVFNLWSANLVLALLPLIDPGQQSQVNCIVGRFDLKDGGVTDDLFLIDTTSVRIRGTGQANLRSEELAFVFRPRAKGLGLFRLQTPMRVSGTLSDQRFGFDPGDVFYSGVRMVFSPILVPIERLTLGPLPRDGADVCTAPLRAGAR